MLRQSLRCAAGLCAAMLLVACSSSAPDAAPAAQTPTDQAPPAELRQPTVIDEQLKALDKAKAVEQELQKAQAERDKEIDAQSGG